jgi:hypothetical protein
MSLFGHGIPVKNSIFTFRQNPGSLIDPLLITVDDLMFLFELLENFEEAITQFYTTQEGLNLDVSLGFEDLTLRLNPIRLYVRRLYLSLEYPLLSNNKFDCKLLYKLYQEHPILRMYDFSENEPQCSL